MSFFKIRTARLRLSEMFGQDGGASKRCFGQGDTANWIDMIEAPLRKVADRQQRLELRRGW